MATMMRRCAALGVLAVCGCAWAQEIQVVPPTEIVVRGQRYPVTPFDPNTDASVLVYDALTGTIPVSAPGIGTPSNVVDDVILAAPDRRSIIAMRLTYRLRSNIPPNATFSVLFSWHDSYVPDPPSTEPPQLGPVNEGVLGLVFSTPPATGWQAGALYDTGWVASDLVGPLISTLGNRGLVSVSVAALSSGGPSPNPAQYVDLVFSTTEPTTGRSLAPYWLGQPGGALAPATLPGESRSNLRIGLVAINNGLPTCYANCDRSIVAPVLNASDFACYLDLFQRSLRMPAAAQVQADANCDRSTTGPALNVLDFVCFLNRFRAPEAGTNCP